MECPQCEERTEESDVVCGVCGFPLFYAALQELPEVEELFIEEFELGGEC